MKVGINLHVQRCGSKSYALHAGCRYVSVANHDPQSYPATAGHNDGTVAGSQAAGAAMLSSSRRSLCTNFRSARSRGMRFNVEAIQGDTE